MRTCLAVLLLACSGCGPSREDQAAELARSQEEVLRRFPATHSISALGGLVIGKNAGEWGGEVAFREPDGRTYRLVDDNSQGIFAMPFGVVALTGLAHLTMNHGAVYVGSRVPGKQAVATKTIELPGWPCGVERAGNEIRFNVLRGHATQPGGVSRPRYECHALVAIDRLEPRQCPAVIPEGCFP